MTQHDKGGSVQLIMLSDHTIQGVRAVTALMQTKEP